MKCFHFTNGENRDEDDGVVSRGASKVSWARLLSVAPSTSIAQGAASWTRTPRDLSYSVAYFEFLSHRRANDLRVFTFSVLKSATKGFSRAPLGFPPPTSPTALVPRLTSLSNS